MAPYPDSDKTASPKGCAAMAWIVLIVSGMMEAVWATALGRSQAFSRPLPTVVFAIGLTTSMAGLAVAMRSLPIGTAYAVWVGIGAVLTVVYAMATRTDSVSALKITFLLGIVACVIGLKLSH